MELMEQEQVKTGYKKTEMGWIPEDWEVLNLGKSSSLKARIGWQGLTTNEYLKTGHYSLVTGTDFENGFVDWSNCVYVEKERYDQDKNIQLKSGDVLVTKDGTIGKVAYIDILPNPTTLNSGVFVIRAKREEYDSQYFYYVLRSSFFKDFLSKLSAGSTINHLYQKDFVFFDFPLPPTLEEQRAIATALSDTDALISGLEKLIAKKKGLKQGAMQQLLTPPHKGGKRLPGFSGEWELKTIEELAQVIGGGTPSTSNIKFWGGDVNWFTPTEIGKIKYSNSSQRKITKEGLLSCSAKILPLGTVLMTSRASIGDLSILTAEGATNQGFQSLVPRNSSDSEFLYYLISKEKGNLLRLSSGSTFLEISPNKVRSFKVFVPSPQERIIIGDILKDIDKEIEALKAKKAKYEQLKQAMMQELLTGKTRLVKSR